MSISTLWCMILITARPFSPDIVQHIMPTLLCTYSSLDIWMIIHLTATKFKSFMFSVLSFTFSYAANIHIFMILYDFWLFPACFHYEIINIRNLESHVHVMGRCAPRETTDDLEDSVLHALQFH
jgi:hypothetical protein